MFLLSCDDEDAWKDFTTEGLNESVKITDEDRNQLESDKKSLIVPEILGRVI